MHHRNNAVIRYSKRNRVSPLLNSKGDLLVFNKPGAVRNVCRAVYEGFNSIPGSAPLKGDLHVRVLLHVGFSHFLGDGKHGG
jgi:hypothetical protein